jgi:hypothetical protein
LGGAFVDSLQAWQHYAHMQPKRTKVLRKGQIMEVGQNALQNGDVTFGIHETEKEATVSAPPLPGTARVKVLAIGPFTNFSLRYQGTTIRVPEWVVLDDGRALRFNRLFRNDGTADVEQGEFILPGGAVYQPCSKTPFMEGAERESRTALAAAKLGIHVASGASIN